MKGYINILPVFLFRQNIFYIGTIYDNGSIQEQKCG